MTDEEDLIKDLPEPDSVRRFLTGFAEKHPVKFRKLEKNSALISDVATLAAFSPLLAATMLQHPEHIAWLERKRGESVVRNKDELLESLARFSLTNSQTDAHTLLSRFRRRELLRIYLRDIRNLATIAEITEEISNLADAILEHALRLAKQELDNRFGTPQETDEKGRSLPATACIVSLGKLGSRELNYSSDIDLLFLYSDEGKTAGVGTREPVTNREYFIKLAELVTKLVGEQAGEGAAYRVDLRLRPHGRVGPLAMSIRDTLRYYQTEAAAWERQVLIRSRSSAGNEGLFKAFSGEIADSVFPANSSVGESLRSVRESKQRIDLENINAKGTNVKLGRGGIREIEFIAQALQLAYGGRDKWLRVPHTLISLSRLADRGHITEHELTTLSEGYAFLRQLEHILQMENGLQTHTLPHEPERLRAVAIKMGFATEHEFETAVGEAMSAVNGVYKRVFSDESIDSEQHANAGKRDPAFRLDEPTNLEQALPNGEASGPIERVLRIAPRFAELAAADASLADFVEKDLEQQSLPEYLEAFSESLLKATGHREKLAVLRRTWHRQIALIIARDALNLIGIREAKSLQTSLAEASIDAAFEIAKDEAGKRFPNAEPPAMAVLGLGKLGGAGVDYDSDLDLVIVYDDGQHANQHATRIVESFVNALSAMTREGSLYRVDLRLRPHGKDGPPAISRDAFTQYMREDAAIWELLAFVKLRGVGGDLAAAKAIEAEVREVIHAAAKRIEPGELAAETRRIRTGLEKNRADLRSRRDIDIKYGEGGMLDVYFACRFLQLRDDIRDADGHRSTDATLERLHAAGSLDAENFQALSKGYKFLSALDHALRLAVGRSTRLPLANKKALAVIADRLHASSTDEMLAELSQARLLIREAFDAITQKH